MIISAILAPRGGGALIAGPGILQSYRLAPFRLGLALAAVGETPTGQPPGRRRYEIQLNRVCRDCMCRRCVKDEREKLLLLDPVATTGDGLAGGQRRPGSAAKSIGVPFTAERKGRTYDGSEQTGLFDIAG
jgi:hypothetical protein